MLGHDTPYRLLVVPDVWGDQVFPPLVVAITVPKSPTAKQWLLVGQETPRRLLVVPDDWAVHLDPPSFVAITIPWNPTAMQWLVLAQEIPCSAVVELLNTADGILRSDQVRPPFFVSTALPTCALCARPIWPPTPMQRDNEGQETAAMPACLGLIAEDGGTLQAAPPFVVFASAGTAPKLPPVTQHVFVPFTHAAPSKLNGTRRKGRSMRHGLRAATEPAPNAEAPITAAPVAAATAHAAAIAQKRLRALNT